MPSIKRDFYLVCPFCGSTRVEVRTHKKPRYRCKECGETFMNKKRITHEDRLEASREKLLLMEAKEYGF